MKEGPGRRLLLLVALLLTACDEPAQPSAPPVTCETTGSEQGGDTLRVVISLDSLAGGRAGRVLVRVDGLQDGQVRFQRPVPSAAAASMTVDATERFHGCAGFAVDEIRLGTRAALAGKAWVQVASARPVRVLVRSEEGPLESSDPLIPSGRSGVVTWTREER